MKKIFYLLAILTLLPPAVHARLSRNAVVSLITYEPSEGAVFTVYGHTAIRVKDVSMGFDYVFNYGIFDFSSSNFIYRFTKGETDYKLGITDYQHLVMECSLRGCGARELVLNLSESEKEAIFEALLVNARPENATYRYNFFYDNCATRPAEIIEKHVKGSIVYANTTEEHTFRQLINHCMCNNPWMIFGTELVLGVPTDRIATPREEFFLPLYLEAAFEKAVVFNPDGTERRLVLQKNILFEDMQDEVSVSFFTPMLFSLSLLAIVLVAMLFEFRNKTHYGSLDCVFFFVCGLAGCLVFFLSFVSVHPATWPNCLVLWLHPFHLLGAVFMAVDRLRKCALVYSCANLLLLSCLLIGWNILPQHFNTAFLPLVAIFWLRSGFYIFYGFSHRSPSR